MNEKLKVVWICHFSNDEIKTKLKPIKDVKEYAAWMPLSISVVERCSDIDLYIIAPYPYICGVKSFCLRGIHYFFFNPSIPLLGLSWPRWFKWDYISNFRKNKRIVSKLVKLINPDVIHLFGAENPYYSSTILPLIDKYPTILTVQGFASHSPFINDSIQKRRSEIEKLIISKMYISFYESKFQANAIKEYNQMMDFQWFFYGSYKIEPPIPRPEIKYDMVFFARINREKGIVDLLEATKVIKETYKNDVSLCVIGAAKNDEFIKFADELGLSGNVTWTGFLPTRDDVHRIACQAKLSVLPTYHDINPGTIIESMFLQIPVVAYSTDNLPEINEKSDVIKLVEKGNVKELAKGIIELLKSPSECERIKIEALKRANEMYAPSDDILHNSLFSGYSRAIELFNQKK